MNILVVNAGSSSLKYALYDMRDEKELISGYIEKIGSSDSICNTKTYNGVDKKEIKKIDNHSMAVNYLVKELIENNIISKLEDIDAIGHRVLHGGEKYKNSVEITDEVITDIEALTDLGPLHHPGNLAGINAFKDKLNTLNVAVFDTSFHQSMPKKNYIYPVPYEWYQNDGVRKYGFHGTSHKYITEVMKKKLGFKNVNLVICHVGSGASISCIKDGKCLDTTMGLTPLAGIMMGTRSGDIDPSIIERICKTRNLEAFEVTKMLNKESGLFGVSGVSDYRDVLKKKEEGDEKASLALDIYHQRISDQIAVYINRLDGAVDAVVFTAGVLENSSFARSEIMNKLNAFRVKVDEMDNNMVGAGKKLKEGIISAYNSNIDFYVVPTNEELMIARDTYEILKQKTNDNMNDKVYKKL